eukprot:Gb_11711 [translate_table: standard]
MAEARSDVERIRILIIGATGHIGRYMAKASVSLGYPTFAFVRPSTAAPDSPKAALLGDFTACGIHILQGCLDDHDSLVEAIRKVDIVISAVAFPQILDQLNITNVIKEVGHIKRFVPSEFGNEVDRLEALPPLQRLFDNKKKIRRTIEEEGIPHTIISANSFAAYFVDYFLHPPVLNLEDDIAAITIKAAFDPRTLNKLVIYRPPANIISQSELVSLWEKKTGRTLRRVFVPETELIRLSQTLPHPDNVPVSVLHNIFVKGVQTDFELGEEDLEASKLYPDYEYTNIDKFLDICIVAPRDTKLASFA